MHTVAEGWLALQLSNSAFIVGLVAAAGTAPVLFLSLYGGVVADRRDKLKLVRIAQSLLLIEPVILWWATYTGHINIPGLIALAAFAGTVSAFEIPARQSLIVELVGREDLVEAIALNSGGFNLARIIGPAIGALVIATAGISWCFGLNALSYFAVLAGLFMIHLPEWKRPEQTHSSLEGIKQGFDYIRSTPAVYVLVRIVAVYSIFGLSFLTMLPVIARDVLHTGVGGYGFLMTSVGVGALTGALSLATLGQRVKRGELFRVSSYCFAIGVMIFAFVNSAAIAGILLFLVGIAMLLNGALANGILQSITPDNLRGRVVSVYVFVYVGFAPIGSVITGALARALSVHWAIVIGASIMLVYTAWELWRYPALREV